MCQVFWRKGAPRGIKLGPDTIPISGRVARCSRQKSKTELQDVMIFFRPVNILAWGDSLLKLADLVHGDTVTSAVPLIPIASMISPVMI